MTSSTLSRQLSTSRSDPGAQLERAAIGRRLQTWGPAAALVILVVIFVALSPSFGTLANVETVLDASAIPFITATGLTFVVLQGSIDLSLQGVMAASSMVVALVVANSENHLDLGWAGVGLALLVSLLFGAASGLLHVALRLPSLMVTIGIWYVGLGFATALYPARQPQIEYRGLTGLALDHIHGVTAIDLISVCVLVAGVVIQRNTMLGRACYAVGGSEQIARLSGLRIDRYKVAAFAFSGLMAGLAGILASARLGVGSVDVGTNALFSTVSAVVIGGTPLTGGRGGVLRSAIGVLILQVLRSGLVLTGSSPYIQEVVQGAAIVAAVAATNWHLRRRLRVVK